MVAAPVAAADEPIAAGAPKAAAPVLPAAPPIVEGVPNDGWLVFAAAAAPKGDGVDCTGPPIELPKLGAWPNPPADGDAAPSEVVILPKHVLRRSSCGRCCGTASKLRLKAGVVELAAPNAGVDAALGGTLPRNRADAPQCWALASKGAFQTQAQVSRSRKQAESSAHRTRVCADEPVWRWRSSGP